MKKTLTIIAALLVTAGGAFAQKWEGLADTPQMGWNSWNKFATNINEDLVKDIAQQMIDLGLADAGYVYINIDDGWHGQRDAQGFIHEDPEKFPSGIKALADFMHEKGLKLGIYSDAGTQTCGCYAGSLGHEYQDALTYAHWGIDYLKYDWCFTKDINPKGAYTLMRNALREAGRPIFFSMCEWGSSAPWEWAAEVGHSWRTTGDISANFAKDIEHFDPGNYWRQLCVLSIVDMNEPLRQYAGPGHWNDPDMLEVGNGMSLAEDRAHFSLWCMMAAPLLLGNDITKMDADRLAIVINKDAIAIDQDPLGIQGFRYKRVGDIEYWFKPLQDGKWAFCVFNRGEQDEQVTFNWEDFCLTDDLSGLSTDFDTINYTVSNIWSPAPKPETTRGTVKGKKGRDNARSVTVNVPLHDVVLYRLDPVVSSK